MFDALAATFYNNVVGSYDEYVEHRDTSSAGRDRHLRTAVAAATALYHFREHLPDNLRAQVNNLETSSDDFALIRGVVNASKHKRVTKFQPLVSDATDIREITVVIRYADDQGDYSHAQTKIDVICTDGTIRWLDIALTRVLNFWGMMLQQAGACSYIARPEPSAPGSRFLSRDDASTQLDLEAMKGLDFRQTMQLLSFDNQLGRAIPIDLTDADIQFRIYQPPERVLDVKMQHPKYGTVVTSVNLTATESLSLNEITSEVEYDAFMTRLFQAHQPEIERQLLGLLAVEGQLSEADHSKP